MNDWKKVFVTPEIARFVADNLWQAGGARVLSDQGIATLRFAAEMALDAFRYESFDDANEKTGSEAVAAVEAWRTDDQRPESEAAPPAPKDVFPGYLRQIDRARRYFHSWKPAREHWDYVFGTQQFAQTILSAATDELRHLGPSSENERKSGRIIAQILTVRAAQDLLGCFHGEVALVEFSSLAQLGAFFLVLPNGDLLRDGLNALVACASEARIVLSEKESVAGREKEHEKAMAMAKAHAEASAAHAEATVRKLTCPSGSRREIDPLGEEKLVKDEMGVPVPAIHVTTFNGPIPMILTCIVCGCRHIDAGEWAKKPHHTHACQACGVTWRPAVVATVGVQHLPGFKDELAQTIELHPAGMPAPPPVEGACPNRGDRDGPIGFDYRLDECELAGNLSLAEATALGVQPYPGAKNWAADKSMLQMLAERGLRTDEDGLTARGIIVRDLWIQFRSELRASFLTHDQKTTIFQIAQFGDAGDSRHAADYLRRHGLITKCTKKLTLHGRAMMAVLDEERSRR